MSNEYDVSKQNKVRQIREKAVITQTIYSGASTEQQRLLLLIAIVGLRVPCLMSRASAFELLSGPRIRPMPENAGLATPDP